jgi:tetratricopeptide (TPR) repeat protein
MTSRKAFLILFVSFLVCNQAYSRDNRTCDIVPGQPIDNAYGPFDFTNPDHQKHLPIVLGAHFVPKVERLISGNRGSLVSDIDYTLRAIPNYHRALNAMAKYQRRKKEPFKQQDKYWTAECYFKRAIYMQPKDAISRMLYAMHLHISKQFDDALIEYKKALEIQPYNIEIHYNIGLLYVDLGRLDLAEKHAQIAEKGGYPLNGIRNRISKAANK